MNKMNKNNIRNNIILGLMISIFVMIGWMINYYRVEKKLFTPIPLGWEKNFSRAKQNPSTAYISITSNGLSPTQVSIQRGWQVTWVNKDETQHRIVSDPYPGGNIQDDVYFDSDALDSDESFTYTFNKEGTFSFHDEEDPLKVKGVIIVK